MAKDNPITLPHNFTPRPYQLPFFEAMDFKNPKQKKRAVLIDHRRCGKDKSALNFTAKEMALRVGAYYYFFPTYNQGRKIIWDGKDKVGFPFLGHFPEPLVKAKNSTEMKLTLINDSILQVVGSDNIDTVVGTNPVGCVFSEFALQDPRGWDFMRPILRENDGWAIFPYCVAPNSIIWTKDGLRSIGEELKDATAGFSKHEQSLFGLRGMDKSEMAYRGPRQKTLKIKTAKGYELECTPVHPIWNGTAWQESGDWCVGDRIPIQLDQQVFGESTPGDWKPWLDQKRHGLRKPFPFDLDADLCYAIGLYIAEGSSQQWGCTISNADDEIKQFLAKHDFVDRGDTHNVCSNTTLVDFFHWLGAGRGAKNKRFSNKVLSLKREYLAEVLRGYYDGDGCATLRGGVHCDTVSSELAEQVQAVLLNFGIISSRRLQITKPTARVEVESHCWRVETTGHMAGRFFERIGFRLQRKQSRRTILTERQISQRQDEVAFADEIPSGYWKEMNDGDTKRQMSEGIAGYCTLERLQKTKPLAFIETLLRDGYHWDKIVSITDSENEVLDFVIPSSHSFTTNGFISHNTPRGKNHGWDLYKMAKDNDDWYTEVLTIDDTYGRGGTVGPEEVDLERKAGMSENLIQQEYYVSFEAAVENAVFGQQLWLARSEKRIATVPWITGLPVNTYWDIGWNDATAIWFVQTLRGEVRLIDYHENRQASLDHYIKFLKDKPYLYGTHNMPHDAGYKDFKTGKSVQEIGWELGIDFEIVPKLSEEDQINAARMIFNRCWFDEDKCAKGIDALSSYHFEYDTEKRILAATPLHNWASHASKAFELLAVAHVDQMEYKKPDRYSTRKKQHRSWMAA